MCVSTRVIPSCLDSMPHAADRIAPAVLRGAFVLWGDAARLWQWRPSLNVHCAYGASRCRAQMTVLPRSGRFTPIRSWSTASRHRSSSSSNALASLQPAIEPLHHEVFEQFDAPGCVRVCVPSVRSPRWPACSLLLGDSPRTGRGARDARHGRLRSSTTVPSSPSGLSRDWLTSLSAVGVSRPCQWRHAADVMRSIDCGRTRSPQIRYSLALHSRLWPADSYQARTQHLNCLLNAGSRARYPTHEGARACDREPEQIARSGAKAEDPRRIDTRGPYPARAEARPC